MDNKSRLSGAFLLASSISLGAASAVEGLLIGTDLAVSRTLTDTVAMAAASSVVTATVAGLGGAGAWMNRNPERPLKEANYIRNLIISLSLGSAIATGSYGYRIMSEVIKIADEARHPAVVAAPDHPFPR